METIKKVSVVLTTYNGEKYIAQQLETIAIQTYPISEVIIIDDKSTDNTVTTIKEFNTIHSINNWRLYVNAENIGWKKNFIQAINMTSGDIIFLADQDDIWRKDKIEKMVKIMQNNTQIEVLASNLIPIYEEGGLKKNRYSVKAYGTNILQKVDKKKYYLELLRPGCCFCFKKEIISLINNIWFSNLAHDSVIWQIGAFRGTLYIYNEALIYQRRHKGNNNLSSQRCAEKRSESLRLKLECLKNIYNIKEDIDLNNCAKGVLIKSMRYYQCRINLILNKNVKNCIKALTYITFYPKFLSFIADLFSR